jgi:ferritin-like protein
MATPSVAAAATPPPDLAGVLEVDQLALYVIGELLSRGIMHPAAGGVASRIHEHEQTHVQLLGIEVARVGQTASPGPRTVAEADRRLSALNASGRLSHVHSSDDALRLIYDLVSMVIGQCWEALHTLTDAPLIRSTAEIMAAEAQHASAIGGLLHPGKWERVVPVGSVEGKH